MTTFDDREHAYEAKFAHDEEFRFLVDARRDKLFAHWAAATAGISGASEDALVSEVLAIQNGSEHIAAVLRYVRGAMAQRGVAVEDQQLAIALGRCAGDAHQQLTDHPPEHSDII